MDLKSFKIKFDEVMKTYVDKKIKLAKDILNHDKLNEFIDYFHDYIFKWWKRTRPYVIYLSYKTFGGENNEEIMRYGIIFELLHTMALIHDDIIDQSDKRHNVPTIHHYIASKINNMHIAEGQAILLGDLMLSRVYELQNKFFNFPEKLRIKAKNNIHAMIEELILWQMIDVNTMLWEELSDEHLKKKNLYKSAKYSFSRPMATWAILANADENSIQQIEKLWIKMWLAYQVRDDLMDLVQHDSSKSEFSDIQEGQQTYFTHYIFNQAKLENKTLLKSCLWKALSPDEISSLKTMFHESGAIDYGKKLIQDYGQEATQILETINFTNPEYKPQFSTLIQKITNIDI